MRISAYKQFFYLQHTSPTSTQRRGPVTAAQLRHEWGCGGVHAQTLVFAANGSMRGWMPIVQARVSPNPNPNPTPTPSPSLNPNPNT